MQSQKSLANATKSIAKLIKVHDHTSQWSLLDAKKSATNRGSAHFVTTRLTTANPENFSRDALAKTGPMFNVKHNKGSVNQRGQINI